MLLDHHHLALRHLFAVEINPWLSISFEAGFRHLWQIDEMWGAYFEALRISDKRV